MNPIDENTLKECNDCASKGLKYSQRDGHAQVTISEDYMRETRNGQSYVQQASALADSMENGDFANEFKLLKSAIGLPIALQNTQRQDAANRTHATDQPRGFSPNEARFTTAEPAKPTQPKQLRNFRPNQYFGPEFLGIGHASESGINFTLAESDAIDVVAFQVDEEGDSDGDDGTEGGQAPNSDDISDGKPVDESDVYERYSSPGHTPSLEIRKDFPDKDEAGYVEVREGSDVHGAPHGPKHGVNCPTPKMKYQDGLDWNEYEWIATFDDYSDAERAAHAAYKGVDTDEVMDTTASTSSIESRLEEYLTELGWVCTKKCILKVQLIAMNYQLIYGATVVTEKDEDTEVRKYHAWIWKYHAFNAYYYMWCDRK